MAGVSPGAGSFKFVVRVPPGWLAACSWHTERTRIFKFMLMVVIIVMVHTEGPRPASLTE